MFEGSLRRGLYFFFSPCVALQGITVIYFNFIMNLSRCKGYTVWRIVTIAVSKMKR